MLLNVLNVIHYYMCDVTCYREVYNPSRADTCLLTAAAWGAHTGAWLSWHTGLITDSAHQYSETDIKTSVSFKQIFMAISSFCHLKQLFKAKNIFLILSSCRYCMVSSGRALEQLFSP